MVKKSSSKRVGRGVRAKSIKKRINPGAKSTEVVYHSTKEIKVERALIENFIGLQKVMVNLSNKFDNLSSQISKLLDLFEISAKALAKKELASSGAAGEIESRRIMERLDNISQQAGLIGKGLALIHEVGTENERPIIPLNSQRKIQPISAPLSQPMFQNQNMASSNLPEKMTKKLEGFEKSIAHKDEDKI